MANQEPTKFVLRKMTKSQLINLGGTIFIYTKRRTWLGAFVFGIGFGVVAQLFYKHTAALNVISFIPVAVVATSFIYTLNKAGKKFWNEIKDKEEPITIK